MSARAGIGTICAMGFRAEAGTDSRVAARAAAIASLGAAVIHTAVTPDHWRDWLPAGVFFASIAMFQLIWAVLAWTRPPSAVLAAGIAANAGIAALWVLSRTAGQPFGPNAGQTEAVQAAGICALLLECYVVMGAAWGWFRAEGRAAPVSGLGSTLVLLGANAVIASVVAVGLVSGVHGHDHHRDSDHREDPTTASAGADRVSPSAHRVLPPQPPVDHGDHGDHGDHQDHRHEG